MERKAGGVVKYLRYRGKIILMFLGFGGVILVISLLYHQRMEGIWYALGLCCLLGVLLALPDMQRFARGCAVRRSLPGNVPIQTADAYEGSDLVEQEYLALLRQLSEDFRKSMNETAQERKERQEYYTTWVHQIKTPISAMNMILQREDTAEHRELSAQLFYMEEYVEMVLHYSRLEEGGSDYVFARHDLDDLLRKSIRKYAPLFVRKRISLHYEGIHQEILTDGKWFCFLIEQILSNAIKYTKAGSVTIRLSAADTLSVSDTGIGIAAEDIPRIFEKGFTGYNGREHCKSTGLGLYLCKKTADRLGHRLYASSEVGTGTTFFIGIGTPDLKIE